MNKAGKVHIAYIGRVLPSVSETFVVREIAALRRRGIPISAFSVHPFDPNVLHPEAPDLNSEIEVLTRPSDPRFWLAHLLFAIAHPGRYAKCMWKYVFTGEKTWALRLRCLRFFLVAPFFACLVRQRGITHIHAHFANAATSVAMMAATLAGVPFSFTVHTNYEMIIDNTLMHEKLSEAKFVVTISRFNIENYLLREFGFSDADKLFVVRCGIDCDNHCPNHHSLNSAPLIVSVGRLYETKGFHTLVDACKTLKDLGVQAKCLIIGGGPERERLQRQIEDENLSDTVTLLGELLPENVKSYLAKSDVFALPCCTGKSEGEKGHHDGIPVALMEAMAMGVPSVSTFVGGIPELVHNGETGLLVQPEDPEKLAHAIAEIIRNPELAQKLSVSGRDHVQREFNIHRSADRLFRLFMKGTV